MNEFRMPSLGSDMETGTLVEWLVHVGDRVEHGDVVATVETQKGLIEVEIFTSGVVEKILVEEGSEVPVGTVLALISPQTQPQLKPESEPQPEPQPRRSPASSPARGPAPPLVPEENAVRDEQVVLRDAPGGAPQRERFGATEKLRRRVSPLARRRAAELGVDVSALPAGSGAGGAIAAADVERAAAAPPTAAPPAAPRGDAAAAMRQAIAKAMARSKREIPHYYLGTTVDMEKAIAWLEKENSARPVTQRLLTAVLMLRAVALAVREVPEMNGYFVDGAFRPGERVNLGVAISLRAGGLVAPALHDVDRLSLDELSRRLLDLVQRARTGRLRSSEIAEATITVTNLGDQGVETVFGVIYPPQVALVGFGKVVEQPRAMEGMIGVHPTVVATLAGDHRVSDGHRGGRFLAVVDRLLQEPENL